MFFDGWDAPLRTVLLGVSAYVALVVMLRLSGKRTLSKMYAFDLVVTVALGSTLATILLSQTVTLAQGIAALATLIGLQFAVAWSVARWPRLGRAVKSEPRLLLLDGRFLTQAMRDERVSEDEVLSALRSSGTAAIEEAGAVILESDGSMTVLPRSGTTMRGVVGSGRARG